MPEPKIYEQNAMFALPHPYPAPKKAVGISVSGDGDLLPKAMRSEADETRYEFVICAKMPKCYHAADNTALAQINAVLSVLGMPMLGDMVSEKGGIYQELSTKHILRSEECVVHYMVARQTFEAMYRLIATSDYVQLSPHAEVGYIIGEIDAEQQQRFYQVYREMFGKEQPLIAKVSSRNHPQASKSPRALHPSQPAIFPIVDRELSLVGFMTQHPFQVISLNSDGGIVQCTSMLDD